MEDKNKSTVSVPEVVATAIETEGELDCTFYDGMVCESSSFCFEATRILREDKTPYDGVSVAFTDKRGVRSDWKTDHWDNTSWMIGILREDPSCNTIGLDEQALAESRKFFRVLVLYNWLVIDSN